jgi:hypothetical protein
MRGTRAKMLRKMTYKDMSLKNTRIYDTVNGGIINVGERGTYQLHKKHFKKVMRGF